MKCKFIIAVIAAATILTSCSKEGNTETGGSENSVKVQITQADPATRTETTAIGNQSITIVDGHLYFVSGSSVTRYIEIIASGTTDFANNKVTMADLTAVGGCTIPNVPESTTGIILLANLPASVTPPTAVGATVASVNAVSLGVNAMGKADGSVDNVSLYGTGAVVPDAVDKYNNPATSTVIVKAVSSRIEIAEFEAGGKVDDYEIAGIYVDNTYHTMAVNGTVAAANLIDNGNDEDKFDPAHATFGYNAYSFLYDEYTSTPLASTALSVVPTAPADVWAYNVFPGNHPKVVIHLENVEVDGVALSGARYLTIGQISAWNSNTSSYHLVTAFENGVVYHIAKVEFDETNITTKPNEKTFSVEATITLTDWVSKNSIVNW